MDWATATDAEIEVAIAATEKRYAEEREYDALIADLEAAEKRTGLYLTDRNVDAENAGVPVDHPEFFARCTQSAAQAAGFRAEEEGQSINEILGRVIY